MPPKFATCATCGQEVLKAQTLEIAPGKRACRSHTETQSQAAERKFLAHEGEQKRQAAAEAKRRKFLHPDPGEQAEFQRKMTEWRQWTENHCWTCGTAGMSLQEYFFAVMVANKRLQLRGQFNFLTMHQDLRRELGNPVVLALLPYDDSRDTKIRNHLVDKRIKDIIHFIRQVRMCGSCIEKAGVQDRLEALVPNPTFEQIEEMMPVVAALDPVLTALATQVGEN